MNNQPNSQSKIQGEAPGRSALKLPPNSPSNNKIQSSKGEDLYQSRFDNGIPQERMRKSHSNTIKLNQSVRDKQLETTVQINSSKVTVREEPVVAGVEGFQEHKGKKFKKFSINAIIAEKDLVKESNYFDQTHFPDQQIKPATDRHKADFRIGQMQQLETFQVKTFLFDRNLPKKQDS